MGLESVYKGWNNTTPRHTSVEPSCRVWPLLIADPAVAFLSALTHSSSFTSHTVFNFWGIQPPTTSLFLQLNLLTVSSCLLPNPSPYSLSFILFCCFFYLCSLIFLSLGPRFLLHLFIYLFIYGAEYLHLFWLEGYLLMIFECCSKGRVLLKMRQNTAPDLRKHNKKQSIMADFCHAVKF